MKTQIAPSQLTTEQEAEMRRLKSWFPFRIIYGAINPETGDFECGAVHTKRTPNDLARKGWTVFLIGQK